ncbi:MAG: PorV/PorQ family protein [Flavobacteriales bacterium]|nr:PorV/PorQ family protein [Flavobacteriales bacterium]
MNRCGILTTIAIACCCLSAKAQIGGTTSFQVLQAISPARTAALGGNALAVKDGDLNLGLYAPSLLYFSIGANVKYVMSQMAEYNASALLVDMSATYYNPENLITATLMMRNIGRPLSSYRPGVEENIPFEIQAGVSKRLDKAPLRFSIIGENLQVWRLSEDRTGQTVTDPLTGETIPVENEGFAETLARHLVFNTEIILSENFFIRLGYNYNRRQELKIDTRPGTGGFTYGFGLRVSKFHLSYARASFNLAGVANHFGLSVRFDDFKKS